MQLSDIEWGDVLSDKDGVLVVEGRIDGVPCVVKRYAEHEHRREISNYALLRALGIPTLDVLGSGADWIAIERIDASAWRLGTAADMADPEVARCLAHWYAALHTAGVDRPELDDLYYEFDALTPENLTDIAARWPELATGVAWAAEQLPNWHKAIAQLPQTITYNDFYYTNFCVARDGGAAMMFDYNMLGRCYPYADVRNVVVSLSDDAARAFRSTYEELMGPVASEVIDLDHDVSHTYTLIAASRLPQLPRWAEESYNWLTKQGL